MEPIKTIHAFKLWFTNKKQMQTALDVVMSETWLSSYEIIYDGIDKGDFAIVEFYWDVMTPESICKFLDDVNKATSNL